MDSILSTASIASPKDCTTNSLTSLPSLPLIHSNILTKAKSSATTSSGVFCCTVTRPREKNSVQREELEMREETDAAGVRSSISEFHLEKLKSGMYHSGVVHMVERVDLHRLDLASILLLR